MIVVHARFPVNEDSAQKFVDAFRTLREHTQAEPGNIAYQLYSEAESPTTYLVVEQWLSREALLAHAHAPHTQSAMADFVTCFAGAPELEAFASDGPISLNELIAP